MAGGSLPVSVQSQSSSVANTGNKYLLPLVVLTSLFFMWGFITSLNDTLIPHLKAVFELNYAKAMMVQTAFFAAYFFVSLPSGFVVTKLGYKTGIIIGLCVAGLGCVMFYPAAGVRSYGLFLLALFVLASGITLLQVAANPFVAVLGKPETASSRLTMTQALNSFGTTIGPYLGSAFILSKGVKSSDEIKAMAPAAAEAYKIAEASSTQTPYLVLAAALVVLGLFIAAFKLPRIESTAEAHTADESQHASAWTYRHLVLGAVAIFVYVGAEVAIGSVLANFFHESYIAGMPIEQAGKYVSFYWGGAMVGRFIGTLTLRMYRPGKVLALHAVGSAVLVVLTMLLTGPTAMWAVIAVGLFNSIMFPTIFTIAIDGLGKHTSQGSGVLCMAIVGGAIIPPITGVLADNIGLHHSFLIPVLCYLYIAWYGLKGHPPAVQKAIS